MTNSSPVLLDLGAAAYAHQAQVDDVRKRMGIDHNFFDCWIYGFLENKNFKIDEAVAKLERRETFEKEELSRAEITDWMMENMQKGIIQVIGNDKEGRVTLYICTARDKPTAARREESRKNFDMFVSYATRLRPESKRCQLAMLINQDKASMWSNLDMTFQADIALRIAKYYPGCIDKMYICKMGRTLSALAKPIFSRLPSIVSDRIIIISDGDIKHGKLLELYDASVLPIALGGQNDCDNQENYTRFAYTIKEYFEQLRAAVKRGTSVKEWELSNLRAAGYAACGSRIEDLKRSIVGGRSVAMSLSHPDDLIGAGLDDTSRGESWTSISGRGRYQDDGDVDDLIDDDDTASTTLVTCDTVNMSMLRDQRDKNPRKVLQLQSIELEPRDLFTDYVNQFMAIESFFRLSLVEVDEREWVGIAQKEVSERNELIRKESDFSDEFLFQSLPPAFQIFVRGFMWLCMMVMSCYFLMGTLFIIMLGITTLIYLFFSMFAHTYYVYMYGAGFIVVAAEFVVCASRGFDLCRSTFQGRIIPPLRPCGYKALIFQVVIYIVGTAIYFIIFCIFASRYDVLSGIQYSVAYGWIVAACLIFISHVVFAFGIKDIVPKSYAHGSRVNHAETTLYLLMDVDLDDETTHRRSSSEVFVTSFLQVLAIATGVAYLANGGIFFLTASVVMQCATVLVSAVFLTINNASSVANIMITAVLYGSLFWMDAVFTMGAYGWKDGWGGSLLAVLFTMLFFVGLVMVFSLGHWKGAVRRWLFRGMWILVLAHLIGCVVPLIVKNYRMGLFVMALAIHLVICIFRTNAASNHYGMCAVTLGFLAVLLACILMGHFGMEETYDYSVSEWLLPNYNTTRHGHNSSTFPPVCLTEFPDRSLDIIGMALFAKLGYNSNPVAQQRDLERWFPDFVKTPIGTKGGANVMNFDTFRRVTDTVNTTIIAVHTESNLHVLMEAMTMWIDVYVASIFSVLMPPEYLVSVMPYLSFAGDLAPLQWKKSVIETALLLQQLMEYLQGPNERVYIVGHGPTGAMGAIIGLYSGVDIKSVVFSSPVILPSKYTGVSTEEFLAQSVLAVQTQHTVFDTWYLRSSYSQNIPCGRSGRKCDELDTTIMELYQLCMQNDDAV